MTLLITCIAAGISTIIWYKYKAARTYNVGTLALMYWGASLMWIVDVIFEFMESGSSIFHPAKETMIDDATLGICVVALGIIIWLLIQVYHFTVKNRN